MKRKQLESYIQDLQAKLAVVEKSEQHTGRFNVMLGLMPVPNQFWEAAKGAVILELRREIGDVQNELRALPT